VKDLKYWGVSYGALGDLIMGLPVLRYFEKKSPGSYKYWIMWQKCSFAAPLFINHPLIDSYVKHHCMQCGYCTPGFVVTSKALLDRNPNPSDEEIREALAGNLCRCGTYPQHPKAVLEAAQELSNAGKAKKNV